MTREEAIGKVYGVSGTKEQHEALEFLIPELRELREFYERQQEDERIRKELVEAFKALDIDSSWNGIPVKSILAWLEDQKPVSNPKWTELTWEDINYLEDLMAKVHYEFRNGIGAESFGKEVLEKFREYKEDEYTDEKEQKGETERAPQGDVVVQLLSEKLNTNTSKSNSILTGRADQKPYEPKNWPADKENLSQGQKPELVRHSPITYTYNSNASRDERLQAALLALLGSDLIQVNDGGYFTKQDLIEWVKKKPSGLSEEDVKIIGRLRSVVNECASYNDALDVNGDYCEGDYAKLDAWLKSLPERKNLPPKQEWNKEDERMLKWIEDILLIADDDLSDKLNGRVSPITDSAYSSMKLCIAKCLSWLKSLPLNLKKKNEDVAKLCSNEWSEEDEKLFWGLTVYVPEEELKRLGVTRDDILKKLKSIRLQPTQLKEAYTEGFDTARHATALAFMNYCDKIRPNGKMCLSSGECEEIEKVFLVGDWEKIERYFHKCHWKPSEEQMDVLNKMTLGNFLGSGQYDILRSLYNDLKKLMGNK